MCIGPPRYALAFCDSSDGPNHSNFQPSSTFTFSSFTFNNCFLKTTAECCLCLCHLLPPPTGHSGSSPDTFGHARVRFCILHFARRLAVYIGKLNPMLVSRHDFRMQMFSGAVHLILVAVEVAAPNMEAITASLERSLQNCSLNNNNNNNNNDHQNRSEDGSATDAAGIGIGISSTSDNTTHISISDTTLELNSHISLPHHWEQCLDLKTGEIYYINWRNGMKAKEDPRREAEYSLSKEYESEEESWYDSEESSSESCPSSKEHYQGQVEKQNVLVVAGCKGCLMYFMVPKQVEDCPKCSGQLLHFDRSENGSP
ncbi:hypothetical protein VNO77_45127 [Canavalia gladiata]|uniref:WW domain-containing protein n=1 Tax=Canavalia gladiata TaxID=3824 RepID=A0AAN9JRQ2_CANGL